MYVAENITQSSDISREEGMKTIRTLLKLNQMIRYHHYRKSAEQRMMIIAVARRFEHFCALQKQQETRLIRH